MRFELLVANQKNGLGPLVLNGAQRLLNEVITDSFATQHHGLLHESSLMR